MADRQCIFVMNQTGLTSLLMSGWISGHPQCKNVGEAVAWMEASSETTKSPAKQTENSSIEASAMKEKAQMKIKEVKMTMNTLPTRKRKIPAALPSKQRRTQCTVLQPRWLLLQELPSLQSAETNIAWII